MSLTLKLFKPIVWTGLALAAAGAQASGTLSTGAAGSGGQQLYNAGKAVYVREIACKSCAYGGMALTPEVARKVLADPNAFGALEPAKQNALRAYFQKRVGVTGR